jgi:hypothetical protein
MLDSPLVQDHCGTGRNEVIFVHDIALAIVRDFVAGVDDGRSLP